MSCYYFRGSSSVRSVCDGISINNLMFGRKNHDQSGAAKVEGSRTMSEQTEKNENIPVVVGASGSIGIMPGGFIAKILSDPVVEPDRTDAQSAAEDHR